MKKILISLAFCLFTTLHAQDELNPVQRRMLDDLNFIKNSFELKYAPTNWKKENFGWDLTGGILNVKKEILANPKISIKEFQLLLKKFFNDVKDYHVGISFFSTEEASLPFWIKGAEGKYFVAYIDREQFPDPPIEEGDEVISFNGRPIKEVIFELKNKELGSNTEETDNALAELTLTNRSGQRGHMVPKGDVVVGFRRKNSSSISEQKFTWHYTPEQITIPPQKTSPPRTMAPQKTPLKKNEFFKKMMVFSNWSKADLNKSIENRFAIGGKKSYMPTLGTVIWQNDEEDPFDAYIFEMPDGYNIAGGTTIAVLRIPHYVADFEEVEKFKELITFIKYNAEALVIDQINNPGGSVFYLYALASLLTDYPLSVPKHHIAMTQQEAFLVASILQALDEIENDEDVKEAFGEEIGGYPIDYAFCLELKKFCQMVMKEWNEGHLYTKATCLFGVDQIQPDQEVLFEKPILIVTNCLDFSGGDFFPAIMQDNKRATLFGTRTAGAGGYVLGTTFSNLTAIAYFSTTGSLAERVNKKPIENLGVTPDIVYNLTQNDLQNDFEDYRHGILKALDSIVH